MSRTPHSTNRPVPQDAPVAAHDQQPSTANPLIENAFSRRTALKALFAAAGTAVLFGLPSIANAATATKETTEALAKAQEQLAQAEKELDELATQFEELSGQLDDTLGKIETVSGQIEDTQASIDQKEEELLDKQDMLAGRVSSSYKSGDRNLISLLLSSASFDELLANFRYVDKINESDQQAIVDIHTIQDELKRQKAELEQQKADLEALKEQQTQQLSDMKAKKDEVSDLLNSLSQDVKDLIAKRDAEIIAAQKAEEEARRKAEEEAAKGNGGTTSIPGDGQAAIEAGVAQQRIVAACKSTPSPGVGLCAAWVSNVFINAGFGFVPGNADDMYASYCTSSKKSALKVGMIIAVPTHPHTAAGRIYGHVGIYIGNNTVMDNIGYIRTIDVDSWISYYGSTSTPRWGWAKGINLEG